LNAIGAGTVLGILLITAATLWQDRVATRAAAIQSSQNILRALENDISRSIRVYDLSLQGVIEAMQEPGFENLSISTRQRLLFDRSSTADYLGSMLVLDARGNIVYDSGADIPRTQNFADRDYFKVQEARPDVGLYVSRPYYSRLRGGDESIAISRRLSNADGSFAGVVMGAMRLAYFRDRFDTLSLGRGGSISLLRSDGVLLMRDPYVATDIGRDMRAAPNVQRILQEGSGVVVGYGSLDSINRIYIFGRVPRLPMVLSLGLSNATIMAPWDRKFWTIAPITLVLCGGIVALLYLFQRELLLRREAEAVLAARAETDGLTGLANRRSFDEALDVEWRAAARDGLPLALLFIDVDHFKALNDTQGHQAGDDFLKLLARTLKAQARRPRDLVARYGGEEFCILMPGQDTAGAHGMAETVRAAIQSLGVRNEANDIGVATVSVGVACLRPGAGQRSAALVEQADAALYRAKTSGRNQVAVAEGLQLATAT
jgi:diguanylate cyclase (GGDEF)-like protein